MRVKWHDYDVETEEPLGNIRQHEECECCNQFSHPFFCLQYKIMLFATYLILTGTDEHWKDIIEQARKEYKQKKELAKKEKKEEKKDEKLDSSQELGKRSRKPTTCFKPEDDRADKYKKRKV